MMPSGVATVSPCGIPAVWGIEFLEELPGSRRWYHGGGLIIPGLLNGGGDHWNHFWIFLVPNSLSSWNYTLWFMSSCPTVWKKGEKRWNHSFNVQIRVVMTWNKAPNIYYLKNSSNSDHQNHFVLHLQILSAKTSQKSSTLGTSAVASRHPHSSIQ